MDRNTRTITFGHAAVGEPPIELVQGGEDDHLRAHGDSTARWMWNASPFTARWLCSLPQEQLAGKRVVELGAGLGLPGLVAARRGARVTVTDLPTELPLLRENCERNGATDVAIESLSWGDAADAARLGRFDVVLCSDLIYGHTNELALALVRTIADLCEPGHTRVIVSYMYRENILNDLTFLDELNDRFDDVPVAIPDGEDEDLWLLEYRLKPQQERPS